MNRARKPLGVGVVLFIGLPLLLLVAGLLHHDAAIRNAPVSVYVQTNLTLPVLLANSNVLWGIPYGQASNNFITPADLDAIRGCLPKLRTFVWLYQPSGIDIGSPTNATVTFWRRRVWLNVEVTKSNGVWQVEDIRRRGPGCGVSPPNWINDWLDKASNKLPY